MRIINPFDLGLVSIQELLDQKQILPSSGNKVWAASIFPKSKEITKLPGMDKDRIVTQIDDVLFGDFTVLNTVNQKVSVNNGAGFRYVKSVEIGDHSDSVKRYVQLDKPVNYSDNARTFLNLQPVDGDLLYQLDTRTTMIHAPQGNEDDFLVSKRPEMFDQPIHHPHITTQKPLAQPFQANNKAVIMQVFKWAREKGVKYIYCINEWRPYVISTGYTTPYVYYTIKGSY